MFCGKEAIVKLHENNPEWEVILNIPKNLLDAMQNDEVEKVKHFLQENCLLDFEGEVQVGFEQRISSIEYACLLNQPEMLKLLVSHYNEHSAIR